MLEAKWTSAREAYWTIYSPTPYSISLSMLNLVINRSESLTAIIPLHPVELAFPRILGGSWWKTSWFCKSQKLAQIWLTAFCYYDDSCSWYLINQNGTILIMLAYVVLLLVVLTQHWSICIDAPVSKLCPCSLCRAFQACCWGPVLNTYCFTHVVNYRTFTTINLLEKSQNGNAKPGTHI